MNSEWLTNRITCCHTVSDDRTTEFNPVTVAQDETTVVNKNVEIRIDISLSPERAGKPCARAKLGLSTDNFVLGLISSSHARRERWSRSTYWIMNQRNWSLFPHLMRRICRRRWGERLWRSARGSYKSSDAATTNSPVCPKLSFESISSSSPIWPTCSGSIAWKYMIVPGFSAINWW